MTTLSPAASRTSLAVCVVEAGQGAQITDALLTLLTRDERAILDKRDITTVEQVLLGQDAAMFLVMASQSDSGRRANLVKTSRWTIKATRLDGREGLPEGLVGHFFQKSTALVVAAKMACEGVYNMGRIAREGDTFIQVANQTIVKATFEVIPDPLLAAQEALEVADMAYRAFTTERIGPATTKNAVERFGSVGGYMKARREITQSNPEATALRDAASAAVEAVADAEKAQQDRPVVGRPF